MVHKINVYFPHSNCRSKISLCLHSLWCEVTVIWIPWDAYYLTVQCEVIFYSCMERENIFFLSVKPAGLDSFKKKKTHSICLFYWMLCFYNLKKKDIITKYSYKQQNTFEFSLSLDSGVLRMSLAVLGIEILGPKPKWYSCDVILPSDLLNKQTAFSVSPLKTYLTLLKPNY